MLRMFVLLPVEYRRFEDSIGTAKIAGGHQEHGTAVDNLKNYHKTMVIIVLGLKGQNNGYCAHFLSPQIIKIIKNAAGILIKIAHQRFH